MTATAETWRRVGFLDERYFLNFEDSDWSMRARAVGVPLVVDTRVTIEHAVSASFTGAYSYLGLYYYARNGLLFGREHGHSFFPENAPLPPTPRAASRARPRTTGSGHGVPCGADDLCSGGLWEIWSGVASARHLLRCSGVPAAGRPDVEARRRDARFDAGQTVLCRERTVLLSLWRQGRR